MGLERIAAVMQGTHDNYEIDLMRSLIAASSEASGVSSGGEHNVSHRVIADHLRATSFLIADGVLPSNEGRGYVLRRIMRRAMRHAHMMGCDEPLMWQLVPTLIHEMGAAFPELVRGGALISETLKLEEIRFKKTLENGLKLLDDATGDLNEGDQLNGQTAFKLYDTFGFPLDLTQDALRNRGMSVDTEGFNEAMERQRAEARKAWAGSGSEAESAIWFDLRDELGATDFLGYETESAEGQITAIIKDGARVNELTAGDEGAIVVNQTPFYGESGGQMGDSGLITVGDDSSASVLDTKKRVETIHAHMVKVDRGELKIGDDVALRVDADRRSGLRGNHSATHLLHEALRRLLGDHVTQKGSLVAPDRLRFDVSHPKPVEAAELAEAEDNVNRQIAANAEVTTRLMEPDAAVEAGAMALFGEKYGDEVRVVSMGADDKLDYYSTELCGGTHVSRTGEIGVFKILHESAVAAGVRRIEALTGEGARAYFANTEQTLLKTASLLKSKPDDVPARVEVLVEDRRRLERELSEARRQLATGGGGASTETTDVGGVTLAAKLLDGVPAKELKSMVDDLKGQIGSGVVAVVSNTDGKANVVVGVTEDIVSKISAVDLVRAGSAAVGGKGGGGRPDMAQAGGPDGANGQAALDAIAVLLGDSI